MCLRLPEWRDDAVVSPGAFKSASSIGDNSDEIGAAGRDGGAIGASTRSTRIPAPPADHLQQATRDPVRRIAYAVARLAQNAPGLVGDARDDLVGRGATQIPLTGWIPLNADLATARQVARPCGRSGPFTASLTL